MTPRNFKHLLEARWNEGKFLCVGLDPDIEKLPGMLTGSAGERIIAFNRAIIEVTKDVVCAFKPNSAFYEAHGLEGWRALEETIRCIHEEAPDVPVILDAKRGDIGDTNASYARMAFDFLKADAVTVQPYAGGEALKSFLDRRDKGVLVLVRTSNPGAGEFQDMSVGDVSLYQAVARNVTRDWNSSGNCGVVVGTTYTKELASVRAIVGEMPILMPGTGAQGGDLAASVKAGKNKAGKGIIVNASRAVLYASEGSDFAEAARAKAEELHSAILKALVE